MNNKENEEGSNNSNSGWTEVQKDSLSKTSSREEEKSSFISAEKIKRNLQHQFSTEEHIRKNLTIDPNAYECK
jgi:hypothetical protein